MDVEDSNEQQEDSKSKAVSRDSSSSSSSIAIARVCAAVHICLGALGSSLAPTFLTSLSSRTDLNANALDGLGFSGLHLCVLDCLSVEYIDILFKAGADSEVQSAEPLHSTQSSQSEFAGATTTSGASSDVLLEPARSHSSFRIRGQTPLQLAVYLYIHRPSVLHIGYKELHQLESIIEELASRAAKVNEDMLLHSPEKVHVALQQGFYRRMNQDRMQGTFGTNQVRLMYIGE